MKMARFLREPSVDRTEYISVLIGWQTVAWHGFLDLVDSVAVSDVKVDCTLFRRLLHIVF